MDGHLSISPLVDWAECLADGFPLLFFGKLQIQARRKDEVAASKQQ
ncbi:MAG: hypothetical protein IJL50_03105 [Bacteroidaceae bacterium]|nr:hypothetical protein [Bacteroidaceae bacterium]